MRESKMCVSRVAFVAWPKSSDPTDMICTDNAMHIGTFPETGLIKTQGEYVMFLYQ